VYATVRRYQVSPGSEDLAEVGWRLGASLTQLPGFVAAVAVEDAQGGLVTVSLFEDRVSLAAAEPLTERWTMQHRGTLRLEATDVVSGEVVAQKGL